MTVSTHQSHVPDYGQLVKFLFQPFLSATDTMAIDCELTLDRRRVWIRVALGSADQGTAFGRGGRNIQAVRTVLAAAAAAVGQSIHLDVYGSSASSRHRDSDDGRDSQQGSNGETANTGEYRPPISKPVRAAPNRRTPNGQERRSNGDSPSVPPPRPRR
ncbi:KH domain-containing protein [Chamaesiphon minutus]|uniref:Putative RNA-binding protein (Contains KH domain) n=1 Tax=Chamaesiphon minutus (strain ATCC 27169 / PCC 6605) TaxID=1173020 RepID=K9UHV7_CHAP6|nr:KH domain-containing protein [Chamaesiphon minutus]AFY94697.1 putative RNA-binding protein (contains KH domain) [Chamaesiphon minutus PCC 6605]